MDRRIVVIGNGTCGTLAANQLRRQFSRAPVEIVVVDKNDHRDPESELLGALGVFGPDTVQPPDGLGLHAGIGFRHVEAAAVDIDRDEVCLADGTTLGYDVLVVATGRRALAGRAAPNVFTVGGPDGRSRSAPGVGALVTTAILVEGVRRCLAGEPAATYGPSEVGVASDGIRLRLGARTIRPARTARTARSGG